MEQKFPTEEVPAICMIDCHLLLAREPTTWPRRTDELFARLDFVVLDKSTARSRAPVPSPDVFFARKNRVARLATTMCSRVPPPGHGS